MILEETEAVERLNSPLNLLNRLRDASSKHHRDSNGNPANLIPSLPPKVSDVIDDLEDKLAFGSIRLKASGIMIAAMDELRTRLPEVEKPEKLAAIAAEMSKVVNAKNENAHKDRDDKPQFLVYAPQFVNESHYETIHARE